MRFFLFFIFSLFFLSSKAQVYFPQNNTSLWDTISPSSLNWCQDKIDSLYNFLEVNNTKSFILLKNGKIVLEQYFNGHTDTSYWYWASAGKTLTSFLVGMAQEEGFLDILDTTSNYLGSGWTNCTSFQEEKITIWNQLTMTSGLNDYVADPHCTIDTCLNYLSDPGTRWAYHNAPYTLLRSVLENATGQGINLYGYQKLFNQIGMDGLFVYSGYYNLFTSTSRSMARFGLLIQNQGYWNGNQIMTDANYFNQMTNSSQTLNESYGYFWWLNGKSSFMLPGTQFLFNGSLMPNAPNDLIAALGKNGQYINIVPSDNLVWIRMGENPDSSLVPVSFNLDIWDYINDLTCNQSDVMQYNDNMSRKLIKVFDVFGREVKDTENTIMFYIYDNGTVEKKIIVD